MIPIKTKWKTNNAFYLSKFKLCFQLQLKHRRNPKIRKSYSGTTAQQATTGTTR
ncbi:unnamed protein product, partial [Nesidiocoris tenuis]